MNGCDFNRPMKPIKDFDCVQMKWDVQQKLQDEERQYGKEDASPQAG